MHSLKLSKQFSLKDMILVIIGITLFVTAGVIHQNTNKPIVNLSKQDTALNVNKNALLIFSMGNKRLLSDLLWIQTLLESDESHYKKRDLNSWMYLRFLNISVLDPYFYENYMYGGLYLSIVKDDVVGAAEIFERGLVYYPEDYKLNYYAGFNYYFEQGNFEKGLHFLEKIQSHPKAPEHIKFLVGKLKFETTGNYEIALEFLKVQLDETKDEVLKNKIEGEIYALQTELDLKCLNEGKTGCNQRDLEGTPYLLKNGQWVGPKVFVPFRIHRNRK